MTPQREWKSEIPLGIQWVIFSAFESLFSPPEVRNMKLLVGGQVRVKWVPWYGLPGSYFIVSPLGLPVGPIANISLHCWHWLGLYDSLSSMELVEGIWIEAWKCMYNLPWFFCFCRLPWEEHVLGSQGAADVRTQHSHIVHKWLLLSVLRIPLFISFAPQCYYCGNLTCTAGKLTSVSVP